MTEPARPRRFASSAQEAGIGGFLLFFALTQVLTAIVTLIGLRSDWQALTSADTAALTGAIPMWRPFVPAEGGWNLCWLALAAVGVRLLLRQDPVAPRFYTIFLTVSLGAALLDGVGTWMIHDAGRALVMSRGLSTASLDAAHYDALSRIVRNIGYALIWLLYWRSSERVRLTFASA